MTRVTEVDQIVKQESISIVNINRVQTNRKLILGIAFFFLVNPAQTSAEGQLLSDVHIKFTENRNHAGIVVDKVVIEKEASVKSAIGTAVNSVDSSNKYAPTIQRTLLSSSDARRISWEN